MTPRLRPRRRPTAPARRALRRGFTLAELVYAVILLSVGLLALAGLALTTTRMTRKGGDQVSAASVAQARFDSLAGLPCATLAVGSPNSGQTTVAVHGVKESWAVTSGNLVKIVVDTLWVTGRAKPLVYLSEIPCR